MPAMGPICSARSSEVARGLPARRWKRDIRVLGAQNPARRQSTTDARKKSVKFPGKDEAGLFGEELGEVGEGFELEGVAGGVEEEHGGLLAGLAFEAGVRLDDEGDVGGADALGQLLPVGGSEDDAEVGDRDVVAVDEIAVGGVARAGCGRGPEVRDDLVAVEVEVDPVVGAAAFGAGEDGAVEVARGVEVVDWEGDVEGLNRHTTMIPRRECWWPARCSDEEARGAGHWFISCGCSLCDSRAGRR